MIAVAWAIIGVLGLFLIAGPGVLLYYVCDEDWAAPVMFYGVVLAAIALACAIAWALVTVGVS